MLSKLYDVITSRGNVVHVALVTKKGQGTRFRSVHVQWVVLCIDNFLDTRVWMKGIGMGVGCRKVSWGTRMGTNKESQNVHLLL